MLRRGDTFPGCRRLGLFSSESSRLLCKSKKEKLQMWIYMHAPYNSKKNQRPTKDGQNWQEETDSTVFSSISDSTP
jgi:hypothetical protein